MRRRLYAVVAVAALGLALPSHAEEPKKLDGDKNKKIEVKATAGQQLHDDELITEAGPGAACGPERCLKVPFKFDPVAGATGDVVFHITWGQTGTDMDLSVVDAAGKDIATCGMFYGSGEITKVPSADLKKGETYTLIADFYRTAGDEVTATVEFPGSYTDSGTTPFDFVNCGLDG